MKHTMKALAAAVAVAGSLVAGAAEAKKPEPPKDPFAAIKAGRAAFEKENAAPFAKAKVYAFDVAEDALRFDHPAGAGKWAIVLPYSDDSRVRFIDAEFAGGKFAKGQVKVLGFPATDLSAAEFAALRKGFPMAGVKLGQGEEPKATFYPAESAEKEIVGHPRNITADIRSTAAGALYGSLGRFKMDVKPLLWQVTFKGKDGLAIDFGTRPSVDSATYTKLALEALEQKYPERKKRINERDLVDYFHEGVFTYRGALPPPPEKKEAKK